MDFSGLQVEAVRPSSFKGRYSYTSHVLVYEDCPRQYQFFKHWEFSPVREGPMLFGQLVHQTIEDVHKSVLRGKREEIITTSIEDAKDKIVKQFQNAFRDNKFIKIR